MIIDAHAHIWPAIAGQTAAGPTRSLRYGRASWGERTIQFMPPFYSETSFPPEVLLGNMDWIGVDRAVLLQGPFYGEVNEYVWHAVKNWPDRFIGAAYVDPRSPDARQNFRRVTEEYGFHILKFELSEASGLTGLYPGLKVDEEQMAWLWSEAERAGLVVTLDLGTVGSLSYQTEEVRSILIRHPKLKVVIAHLAQPPIGKQPEEQLNREWQEQILLGRHPNVWLDLAALPVYAAAEDYPYPSACRYVKRVADMIGVEKLMWGSDVPGTLVHSTYPQLLRLVSRECHFFSKSDLEKVMGGNAWHVYGPANAR